MRRKVQSRGGRRQPAAGQGSAFAGVVYVRGLLAPALRVDGCLEVAVVIPQQTLELILLLARLLVGERFVGFRLLVGGRHWCLRAERRGHDRRTSWPPRAPQ